MEVPPRALPWKRDGKRPQQWLWRCFGLGRCFPSLKREGTWEEREAWRWLLIKKGSWAMKPKIKEVQKLVPWELIINLASMHEREKGFHSPGRKTTPRKGLSLRSSPGEPWDPSFTSPGPGGIINADQSCVPYA